jgi:dTDP-4-amino-4,6-dideoxygalactose transaminase
MLPALNAKMSEYHAAVALASLKHWAFSRLQQSWIVESYRRGIASLSGVTLQPGYGSGWVGCTTSVVLLPGSREQISHDLLRSGIETRAWWGAGCHVQPAFADCPRGALPVTEDLGARVLGLPQFPDMREQDVDAVVVAVSRAISSRHRYTDRGSA